MFYKVLTGKGGLGNKLFPWARAVIYKQLFGGEIIGPDWQNYLKIGPYLRGERDKRHYMNLFNNTGYQSRVYSSLFKKVVRESDFLKKDIKDFYLDYVVEIKGFIGEGIPSYFELIRNHSPVVHKELLKISNNKLLKPLKDYSDFIGVHIRLSDFIEVKDRLELKEKLNNSLNYRLPLSWYIAAIKEVRKLYGYNKKVLIFSDGSESQLKTLLDLRNVDLVRGNSALTDLLALSKSDIVVASGSTFSMWSVYLGQCNSIFFPNTMRGTLLSDDNLKTSFQLQWEEGEEFPDDVLSKIFATR